MAVSSNDANAASVDIASLSFTTTTWSTAQDITVTGVEDSDVNNETVSVTHAASGHNETIANATATVTIADDEVSTVAEEQQSVSNSIGTIVSNALTGARQNFGKRFSAIRNGNTNNLTIAGREVQASQADRPDRANNDLVAWRQRGAGWKTLSSTTAFGTNSESEEVSLKSVLQSSNFVWSPETDGASGPNTGGNLSFWGAGEYRKFSSVSELGNPSNGEMSYGWLGMDAKITDDLLVGVAVSYGEGHMEYRINTAPGRTDTAFKAIYPYAQWKIGQGGSMSVFAGVGLGKLTFKPVNKPDTLAQADVDLAMLSIGAGMPFAKAGDLTFSVAGDVSMTRTKTKSLDLTYDGLQVDTNQYRVGLEWKHDGLTTNAAGAKIVPYGAFNIRNDRGDGLVGNGLEVAGGLNFASANSRLHLDISGHWLAAHSVSATREWGGRVELKFAPLADGRGLSLGLSSTNLVQGDQEDWLDVGTSIDTAFESANELNPDGMSLNARAGYGFRTRLGTLTAFTQTALASERDQIRSGFELVDGRRDLRATISADYTEDTDGTWNGGGLFNMELKF